ncbi:MAG: ATP-binding protein [Sandaracinaceae bacterium]|nr:ATP-binding protein [Sandaracinaceae bacterium]
MSATVAIEKKVEPTDHAEGPDPYRELFERSADAILIIEGETFVDCNEATVRMLRYESREQVLETHPAQLSPPTQPDGRDSYEKANEMIALAFQKGSHRFEWEHVRANGEVFPVEVLLTAVQRGDERILHVVWRDITERKQLEAHLRQSQKMEAIGKLAGGIAHDFNNLLVAIICHSELLHEALADRPELQEQVDEIRKAGDRAAALVRQLLTFGRKRELMPRVIDLNVVLGEMHKLLRRLIGEHVQLSTVLDDEPVLVMVDPVQVEQVVINLATNARDAMPRGGTLTIAVQRTVVSEGAGPPELEPGPYAVLAVSDTGVGMDEATAQRAFEPFFTTKELGEGTGLGLSTVYGIARQSGGTVQVSSRPGGGTTMEVLLPVASDDTRSARSIDASLPVRGGARRSSSWRTRRRSPASWCAVLRERGYRVLLARDGGGGARDLAPLPPRASTWSSPTS